MNAIERKEFLGARLRRRSLLLFLDGGLILLSFWGAFVLRFGELLPVFLHRNVPLLPWAVGIGLAVLIASGWYRGLTRYSGSHSLYGVVPVCGLAVLLLLLVSTLRGTAPAPFRTFWILYWILLSATLIGSRIVLRDLLLYSLARGGQTLPSLRFGRGGKGAEPIEPSHPAAQPTLIYGAGNAAHLLLNELRHDRRFRLVGLIDDKPMLWGRRSRLLTIHSPAKLPELIRRHQIQQVLLAIPTASRARRRELVEWIRSLGVAVLSIPSLASIASGEHAVSDLREVSIEDLLGREPSEPDPHLLEAAVRGRSVLVTGAGGSIGSELCRQILRLGAKRLVLLERNEFALYTIEQDLATTMAATMAASWPELHPVLGDACHQSRLEDLCRRHGIEVLLHAAAYKHVPLVESNLCAGVANNVFSTRAALRTALRCNLERFLLISTDKAVRPANAMGASKRICELIVQAAADDLEARGGNGPVLSMVRFGNVLGSSGSVVPLFREQIAAGGPVTVTHPEITRYFMTIPEAVQLVLQAAGMARGGEVFVLDMGDPVRIVDLARQMIRLSGSTVRDEGHPEGEIAIHFTGLRPGEKLYEELLIQDSDQPTTHPLIRRAREEFLPSEALEPHLERLEVALGAWDEEAVRALLAELVPQYGAAAAVSRESLPANGVRRHDGDGAAVPPAC